MRELGINGSRGHRRVIQYIGVLTAITALGAASAAAGCGGDSTTGTTSTSATGSTTTGGDTSSSSAGTGGAGGSGGAATTSTSAASSSTSGGTGGGPIVCTTTATGTSHGSAIALSPDDSRVVAVNRDAGSVTVMSVDYTDGQPKMTVVSELKVGGEPWQVVIDSCGHTAYVVLRKDQKVVRIDNIDGIIPTVGPSVTVGSEPTSLAITPNGKKIYVANWVDGTLSVIDAVGFAALPSIDLNAVIAATGALGTVTARPGLAHPRSIAITNNGDANDDDEMVYATEWFASRTGPEDATGTKSDTNWKGLLYSVKVSNGSAGKIDLPSVVDTGFKDTKGQSTGCFPNQVGSVTIAKDMASGKDFAYVTSTCASPVGPIGVFQKGACTTNAQCPALGSTCAANGSCTGSCQADADCGNGSPAGTCAGVVPVTGGSCAPIATNVKTTTHPAMSLVDLGGGTATTVVLDKLFQDKAAGAALRVPLLPTDVDFINGFGYITGEGTDAVFRFQAAAGLITDVGASNLFINLRRDATDKEVRLPIGIVTSHTGKPFAFVNDDGTRDVTALALSAQAIAGDPASMDFRITSSSPLPAAGSPEEAALRGKRFFNTGLGRWSLKGEGWGSCGACHIDGLTDNITWYFARGPRQTVSLDGTFASKDGADQRILNWTAIFDEVADFEGNTRGISGGIGALVTKVSVPLAASDRINTAAEAPPQQGLQGSSEDIADPLSVSPHPHTILKDWQEITAWVKTIRSPRKPSKLIQADVDAGKALFSGGGAGNCVGCHSGAKWTISHRFYTPSDTLNDSSAAPAAGSLSKKTWNTALNGFPSALFPADPASATFAADANMRFGLAPAAEQMQCILRPVGTIGPVMAGVPVGISDPMINVLELRQDMVTGAQGAAATGRGFNPPSLLGMSVGAPYYHAGNARTLEEVFSGQFLKHHQSAVANVFSPDATAVKQLVAYILSIDEDEAPFAIPAKGNTGGDLCF
ncbi:MAG: beta-propeller fold lactonase family protein [Byssovorax sp.]